jgi:ferredoxin
MIVGDVKPISEIVSTIADFRKVLVLGCGGCVSVCLTGGDRQAHRLARDLNHTRLYDGEPPELMVDTIERQCEPDWLTSFLPLPQGTEAVLSLACGAGVQTLAAVYDAVHVVPALNTTFMGANVKPGVWQEMCRGCGDCLLALTGGICPIARCAKNLLNGPCGGTGNGNCEVRFDMPCAWAMIYYKLKKTNQLHRLMARQAPRDWRPGGSTGVRVLAHPYHKPFER